MKTVLVLAASIATAVGALGQEPAVPVGHWQSAASQTITSALHPVLNGGELHLKIDVSKDGSFVGEWGEYFCSGGSPYFSCYLSGKSERASGRLGPSGDGVIDLGRLGRSTLNWSVSSVNELVIVVPKNWQGAKENLYRARMTRDGKPAPPPPPPGASEPLSSAVALYREFNKDEKAALQRYAGKTVVLEGRRGTLVALSDGGAAIHIADGFTSRALVLTFRDQRAVSGIAEGAQFRFTCTVESFDYLYVHLNGCSIVR